MLTLTLFFGCSVGGDNIVGPVDPESWQPADIGILSHYGVPSIVSFGALGSHLFVGTGYGIFKSTNWGKSWVAADSGIPLTPYVTAFATKNDKIFAGTLSGVYLSTDAGTSWVDAGKGLPQKEVWSLACIDTFLFAGTSGLVSRSTNNGSEWFPLTNGWPEDTSFEMGALAVSFLIANGSTLFASTATSIYRSTDFGSSWTKADSGIAGPGNYVEGITSDGSNIFAAVYPKGVCVSTDNGTSWGIADSIAVLQTTWYRGSLFAVSYDGVYQSTNRGRDWKNIGLRSVQVIFAVGKYLFAGTNCTCGLVWRCPL